MELVFEYRWLLLEGTMVTIQLALASLLLSVLLGLIGAWGKLSGGKLFKSIAEAYTTLVRGVPDLVLMLLLFYGGQQMINDLGIATGLWDYVEINQFSAGVFTIGFIFGAYMTESFRGAILAIPRGQIEAGIACGMSRFKIFSRVIWPQMVRYALPSFTNNWLVLIKSTALVSIIGLQDVVYMAFTAGRSNRALFTFMFAVLIIYLILTAISDFGLRRLEKKYSAGVRRAEGA
ncbi:MAG: ABC transporter permease subunit [Alphaproteobacteria bacterium]|nr:ABC transporter permease subunit [Alphaproteobacteria bacterium]